MNYTKALSVELRIAAIINEQARYGWKFDRDAAKILIVKLEAWMRELEGEIQPQLPPTVEAVGNEVKKIRVLSGEYTKQVLGWGLEPEGPFTRVLFKPMDLGSNDKVKETLLNLGWEPTWWNHRKKDSIHGKRGERTSPKLSDMGKLCPNLDKMDSDLGQGLVTYLKYKHRRALLQGLVKVVRDDGRIPGEANTLGTATFRMAHRKIVNIPGADVLLGKEIRSLFIAKPGYKILGCDSKGNQIRMLCHYMNDADYTDKVLNPEKYGYKDVHVMHQELARLPTRSNAKTFFYGFIFGSGDTKTGKIIGGSARDGKKLKETFLNNLPKLKELLRQVESVVRRKGYLKGLDGRHIKVSSMHKALNYLLQGGEAVYMKYAQAFLWKYVRQEKLDAHFVVTVHDEWQMEVREDHVKRVEELSLKAMDTAGKYLGIRVPMPGDVKTGDSWYETH